MEVGTYHLIITYFKLPVNQNYQQVESVGYSKFNPLQKASLLRMLRSSKQNNGMLRNINTLWARVAEINKTGEKHISRQTYRNIYPNINNSRMVIVEKKREGKLLIALKYP